MVNAIWVKLSWCLSMAARPGVSFPGISKFCEPAVVLEVMQNLCLRPSSSNQKDKFSSQKFVRSNSRNMVRKAGSSSIKERWLELLSFAVVRVDQSRVRSCSNWIIVCFGSCGAAMNHLRHIDHCWCFSFWGTNFLVSESRRSCETVRPCVVNHRAIWRSSSVIAFDVQRKSLWGY